MIFEREREEKEEKKKGEKKGCISL